MATVAVDNKYLVDRMPKALDSLEELTPHERYEKRMKRKSKILGSCYVGIGMCVLFALIKYLIGWASNSLAIESDAMSSLTESYSSIIAALGIMLAHKPPTKRFPNGFGRFEFITVIIGAILVIVAGWHYFETSLERIITPQSSSVTTIQIFIILLTIAGKLYLSYSDKKTGTEYQSSGLITASRNALLSCFSSLLVIIGAIVYKSFNIDIDGWVGLIISILMLLTGIIGIKNGIKPLLGSPVKIETAQEVKEILLSFPPIIGVYDLRINNNGAGIVRGTVNAEVPEDANVEQVYEAFRKARTKVYRLLGIDLVIGLLTVNYCDQEVYPKFDKINSKLLDLDGVENIHGFNWNQDTNEVDLHAVIDFNHLNDVQLESIIQDIIHDEIPNSSIMVDFNVNCLENNEKLDRPVCKLPADSIAPA